jgi:hypothetical protein
MNQQAQNSREWITGLVAVIVTLGAFDRFQKDLEPVIGYMASVLGGLAISAIVVFVVCLLGRTPRQKAIAISVLLPPTLATFEQIRKHSVDVTGSEILSLLLAVILSVLVGVAIAVLLSRFAGVDWTNAAGFASSETQRSDSAGSGKDDEPSSPLA